MYICAAPGGAAEPKDNLSRVVANYPGVGQGRAAGKPGQPPACWLPDMLVVAAEGLVDVEQEGRVLGLLQMELLAGTLKQLRRNNCNWL